MEALEETLNTIKAVIIEACVGTRDDFRPQAAHVAAILVGNDEWFTDLASKISDALNYTNLKAAYTELEIRTRPDLEAKVREQKLRIEELANLAEELADDNANLRNAIQAFQAKKATKK